MRYSFIIATIFSMVSFSICANDTYQSEYFFSYNKTDFDGLTDIASKNVGYTYYFVPIKTKNHPLREVAFLEKASEVSIGYNKEKESGSSNNQNSDGVLITAQYITENTILPIAISAEYSKFDFAFDNTSFSSNFKTTGFGVGTYVQDNTKISLQFSKLEFSSFSSEIEVKGMDLEVKSVIENSNNSAFSITGNYFRSNSRDSDPEFPNETDVIYVLNGTYYLNQRSGIGIQFFKTNYENSLDDGKGVDFYVDKFFTKKISVRLNVGKFSASDSTGVDDDSIGVAFIGRI